MSSKPFYFAYGSNMNPARLGALGVRFSARCAASLPGWQLAFRKRASDAPGEHAGRYAYATIVPVPTTTVEGVLYTLIDDDALTALDIFEGVPDLYQRESVQVQTGDSAQPATMTATAYVAREAVCADGLLIEDWYLAHLLAAADLLSPAYVRALRALPVVSSIPRW